MATTQEAIRKPLPFDAAKLDRLLDAAGIDALVVCSKHNIQYLLGGYKFFFFAYMDAMGPSRYLPIASLSVTHVTIRRRLFCSN